MVVKLDPLVFSVTEIHVVSCSLRTKSLLATRHVLDDGHQFSLPKDNTIFTFPRGVHDLEVKRFGIRNRRLTCSGESEVEPSALTKLGGTELYVVLFTIYQFFEISVF